MKNPRWYGQAQAELRRKQGKLARAKRGSNQRKKKLQDVQRQHEQVKNMVQNSHLSKRILDAGWGHFNQRLMDKAADAGREVVLVDPANTSKTCSNCGGLFEGLTLAHRWVECECGLSLDRDHNAAINVLIRAGRVREPERSPSG